MPAVALALGFAAYLLRPTTPSTTPGPESQSKPAIAPEPERLAPEDAAEEAALEEAALEEAALEPAAPEDPRHRGDAELLALDAEPTTAGVVQPTAEAEAPPSALEQEHDARKARRTREQLELEAKRALSSVNVTLYSTAWCGVCRRARSWLRASGIPFREFDVEKDATAQRRMRQLNPKGGVPTIDVDGEVLVGFSPESMSHTLGRAVQKRLASR